MGFVIKWDISGVIDKLDMIGSGMKQDPKQKIIVEQNEGEDSMGSIEDVPSVE